MRKLILCFILITSSIHCSRAAKIQLFDSIEFEGPYLETGNVEGCTNITTPTLIQEARSLKTDVCIMIFKEPDCASFSYRLDPGEYPDLSEVKHETVNFQGSQSFRPCSAGEGGVPVNIDIYGHAMTLDGSEHHEGLLLQYRDVCSCINLPTKGPYIANVTIIHNFGNCIMLYSTADCTRTGVKLLGGVSPESLDLSIKGSFIIPASSIGLCEPRQTCFNLNTTVFKFTLSANETYAREALAKASDFAISTKTTMVNNGTATVTQAYEAKKTIKESTEVTRVVGFGTSSNTYTTNRHVTYEQTGFWFWSSTRMHETITQAYTSSSSAEENGEKIVFNEDREIVVRQQIELPPCSVYEVDSYITVVQNFPVNYTFYSYVSGYERGVELTADEVKARLSGGLTYVEDFDNVTIVAMGQGTIVADFSMEALIEGEGYPLNDCPANVTKVH